MASYAGSGKDTVADIIINDSKRDLKKLSLGYGIHELYKHFNSITSQHNKQRELLQKTGESLREIYGKDIWIKDLEYRKMVQNIQNVIIPDIRKMYEFSYFCIENNFMPIYIKAQKNVAFKRIKERDGSIESDALNSGIERQMAFIEDLPKANIGTNGLQKVTMQQNSPLNSIFVINNDYGIDRLKKQIRDWERLNWE